MAIGSRASKYGISYEAAELLLDVTNCQVCDRHIVGRNHHIDHDHVTGKVRGVLCGKCNRALGQADDNPARLRALADYLDTHRLMKDEGADAIIFFRGEWRKAG